MTAEPSPAEPQPAPVEPSTAASRAGEITRRRFLRGAAAAGAGVFLYTWRIEPHWVDVVRRSLPIDGLPDALVGARVVQISDTHAGPIVDQKFLLRSAERVAELYPDLIVLTGDLVTYTSDDSIPKGLEFVSALPKPRLGRIAILGNHDYGFYWRSEEVAEKITVGYEERGVTVLRNEVTDVAGLQIVGSDDMYTRHFLPESAVAKLDLSRPALALCHNPDAVDNPGWGDYQGWILAGHTHGGQCKPPFLPPPFLPVVNRRYVAGEYDVGHGRRLYINRGLGYLHRVRFNCRPEITVFTLERAAGSAKPQA